MHIISIAGLITLLLLIILILIPTTRGALATAVLFVIAVTMAYIFNKRTEKHR